MSRIYRELDLASGLEIISSLREVPIEMADNFVNFEHPAAQFPPSGGTRATVSDLETIREAVLEIAKRHGFPKQLGRKTASLDRDLAIYLHEALDLSAHTAGSDSMWTFLTICVLPDVAVWRFPERSDDRLIGNVNRNVFRRLWWRVEILGDPPETTDPVWDREDVLVQIMERPFLSGNPDVARTLADVFREAFGGAPSSKWQPLMRDLVRRLMRITHFVSFDALDLDELREVIAEQASISRELILAAE